MEVTVSLPLSSQHTQHSSTQLEQVSEVRSGMYTWSSPQEQSTTVVTSLRQKYKIFELRGVWIFLCRGDHLMLWYSVLSGSDHSHTTPQETTVTISWTVSPSLSLPNTLDTGQSHGTLSATTHTPPHSPHHPHHSHQSSGRAWGTIKGRRGWRGTCPWCFPWWRLQGGILGSAARLSYYSALYLTGSRGSVALCRTIPGYYHLGK